MVPMGPSARNKVLLLVVGLVTVFFAWRMVRPINIFVVGDEFALPMEMIVPAGLETPLASECGVCHPDIYQEWLGSMHLWRGGHDQEMVRDALKIEADVDRQTTGGRTVTLSLTNTGAGQRQTADL
ncbi:MAG: hypothetical protein ABFS18_14465 [Thermodesulfobacteriota bacterium]